MLNRLVDDCLRQAHMLAQCLEHLQRQTPRSLILKASNLQPMAAHLRECELLGTVRRWAAETSFDVCLGLQAWCGVDHEHIALELASDDSSRTLEFDAKLDAIVLQIEQCGMCGLLDSVLDRCFTEESSAAVRVVRSLRKDTHDQDDPGMS